MHLGEEDLEPFGCVFLSAVLGPVSRFKPYLKIYWNLKHCPFVYSKYTIGQHFFDIRGYKTYLTKIQGCIYYAKYYDGRGGGLPEKMDKENGRKLHNNG